VTYQDVIMRVKRRNVLFLKYFFICIYKLIYVIISNCVVNMISSSHTCYRNTSVLTPVKLSMVMVIFPPLDGRCRSCRYSDA